MICVAFIYWEKTETMIVLDVLMLCSTRLARCIIGFIKTMIYSQDAIEYMSEILDMCQFCFDLCLYRSWDKTRGRRPQREVAGLSTIP